MEREITVRNATEEECKALSKIAERCLHEPWSEEDLRKAVLDPCGVVLTALMPEEVPGLIPGNRPEQATESKPENSPEQATESKPEKPAGFAVSYLAGGEGELLNIAVLPEFRKGGIGKALLKGLLRETEKKGCHAMFLEVRASNEAAVALYEGRGFQRVGIRKHFYENPREDALIMKYR